MRLWHLIPIDLQAAAWQATIYKGSVVVRAESEQQARELACSDFSEPVSSGLFLSGSGHDAENAPEIGSLDDVFCCIVALLNVSGQAPVAIGQGPEGGLDPPPHRQRLEPLDGGIANRHLDIDAVARRRGVDHRADIDAVDF